MKTPKPRIRDLYPISMSAIIKRFGWKARAQVSLTPDYSSKSGRINRFKAMPEEGVIEAGARYCIVKPKGAGWAEMKIAGLNNHPKSSTPYVVGLKLEIEALLRRFIIKNSSIKHGQEAIWLRDQLEILRGNRPREEGK